MQYIFPYGDQQDMFLCFEIGTLTKKERLPSNLRNKSVIPATEKNDE